MFIDERDAHTKGKIKFSKPCLNFLEFGHHSLYSFNLLFCYFNSYNILEDLLFDNGLSKCMS